MYRNGTTLPSSNKQTNLILRDLTSWLRFPISLGTSVYPKLSLLTQGSKSFLEPYKEFVLVFLTLKLSAWLQYFIKLWFALLCWTKEVLALSFPWSLSELGFISKEKKSFTIAAGFFSVGHKHICMNATEEVGRVQKGTMCVTSCQNHCHMREDGSRNEWEEKFMKKHCAGLQAILPDSFGVIVVLYVVCSGGHLLYYGNFLDPSSQEAYRSLQGKLPVLVP